MTMRNMVRASLTVLALSSAIPTTAAKVGAAAPPFTLKTYDGAEISLIELRGQVVVLNYWATWCAPCKAEMPAMDAYVRAHPKQGLRVFGITTKDSVPIFRLKPLAAALAYPLVSHFSGRGYGLLQEAVPTTYVIDRAGMIRYAKAASFTAQSFDALITPLLNEPTPPASANIATR